MTIQQAWEKNVANAPSAPRARSKQVPDLELCEGVLGCQGFDEGLHRQRLPLLITPQPPHTCAHITRSELKFKYSKSTTLSLEV